MDYKTLSIDTYQGWTIDKSYYGGHYYSNKAIGAPLLGVPVYWALRKFLVSGNAPPLNAVGKYAIRIFTTTLPFALLGVVLFRMSILLGANPGKALWMVFAYSFGSIALVHATLFSGHQVAASFAFFSFCILFRLAGRIDFPVLTGLKSSLFAFAAGVFAGIAALSDYTAVFIAFVLSVYTMLSRMTVGLKIIFILGGAVCALVLAGYNWTCFDSPLSSSYDYLTFDEFRKGAEKGFLGISFPDPAALFKILVSPSRGLFFIMPVFLFSLTGFAAMWKQKSLRPETLVILVITVGYFFINAGFYGWHGGWTFGPRYLVPILPFLALPMIFSSWDLKSFLLLFGVSLFQVLPAVIGFPHVPQEIINPVVEFIFPCMGYGYMAFNPLTRAGLQGWYPLAAIMVIIGMAVFAFKKLPASKMDAMLLPAIKRLMVVWCIAIVFLLPFIKTSPLTLVNSLRSKILSDAAKATGSAKLHKRAMEESRLAELLEENK